MYGFGKGFGKGKGFQTDDWRGSYKGGKGYVPWNGGGGFTPRWNNQGQGSSDVKELTAMFKANMEKEQWKEEKKEWDDYEKKKNDDRTERERKRVDEMERFKEEMRAQSATTAKEMSSTMKEALKETAEAVKESMSMIRPTPRKRGRGDEDDLSEEPAAAPARRRGAPKALPRRAAAAAAVGASASAGLARVQKVAAPVDLADWDGWMCSRDTAAEVHDKLSLTTPAAELRGLNFEELAERNENGDMKEWKEWHKDNVGEEPKARWTKVQVIQSVLNDLGLP